MSLLSVPRAARRSVMALLAIAFAVVLGTVGAAPASAAAPLTGFYAGPIAGGSDCNSAGTGVVPSTQAGAYTDFCLAYGSKTTPKTSINEPDLKREVIDTPLGFAGSAADFPQCTAAQFAYDDKANDGCPASTQVGAAKAAIQTQATAASGSNVALNIPNVPGKVYNLPHAGNEVARLGIVLNPFVVVQQPLVKVIVSITLRPYPNVGLRSIIDNLPTQVSVNPPSGGPTQTQPVNIDEFALTFWGAAGHTPDQTKPFSFLGSDCSTDQTTHFAGTTYDGVAQNADAAPYRLTGCDNAAIPFAPSMTVSTDSSRPDTTTSTTVHASFAASTNPGFVASTIKSTKVVLPAGLAFSGQIASGADGLPLCTPDQFAQTSADANSCPAATAIGTVTITSPAVQPALLGNAYLGSQPTEHALPDLYIEASLGTDADAPRVKLIGHLSLDDQNRVVASLDNLPQLPVTDLGLTFRGGDHSALITPEQCGTYQGSITASPWTAPGTPVVATTDYSVSSDCDVNTFSPAVGFKVDDPASAGKSSPLTTTISRPDRTRRLTHAEIDLPPGELAFIKGVPECSASDASAGTCPESTKVGTIAAAAGVGPSPYSAPGSIYLTNRTNGDVADLSLHVPVKFGDVDLGQLNVPARVLIRSNDLGLRVIADVPLRFNGIPLNLQRLDIKLDRPNFALSPTNCGPLSSVSHITSDAGNVASVPSGAFQVSGCDKLGFTPQLDAAVTGQTGNGGRPNVNVAISNGAGGLALRQAFVLLPKGLSVDLKQIPRACTLDQFNATNCPTQSVIGTAGGTLAIAEEPLAGDVVLLKVPGQVLPGLGLVFKGRFAGNVRGVTATDPKTSQIRTNFDSIPDLPITSLNLNITGGTTGILVATSDLCSSASVKFGATFVSQAAANARQTFSTYCGAPLGASAPTISARLANVKKGKPILSLSVTAPGSGAAQLKVKQFDIAFPSSYKLSTSRAKSSKGVSITKLDPAGKATTKRVAKNALHVVLPSAGSPLAKVLTRTNTLTIASSSTRKSTKPVVLSASVVYTNGKKVTVPVSLAPH